MRSSSPEDVVVSEGRIGQEQLDKIAKRRQSLVIKKHSSYAYISYDRGSTRMMTRTEILLIVVWARGMGRSEVL